MEPTNNTALETESELLIRLYTTYPDGFCHVLDWSGHTCVIVCQVCGYQEGAFWSVVDGKHAAMEHRQTLHPDIKRTGKQTCQYPECTTASFSHGLCHTHGTQGSQAWADATAPQCMWDEGCSRGAVTAGYCVNHYAAFRTDEDRKAKGLPPVKRRTGQLLVAETGYCTVDGCTAKGPFTRGWCARHYGRWERTGSPLYAADIKACKVEDCPNAGPYTKGMCAMHYQRWYRTGTTDEPLIGRPAKGVTS